MSRQTPRHILSLLTMLAALSFPLGLRAQELTPPIDDPAAAIVTPAPAATPAITSHEAMRQASMDLGRITIDPATKSFRVPGFVSRLEPPLEFAAVTKGGLKAYESLLELECDAFTFNVACLLIGLDEKKAARAERHFDARPAQGDPVTITISWQQDGKERKAALSELLRVKNMGKVEDQWRYTGSTFMADGRFMAQVDGTLIGFVHDPASIVEHVSGLGLNDYGAVEGNPELCPPKGSPVEMTVSRTGDQAKTSEAPALRSPSPQPGTPPAAVPAKTP